MSTKSRFRTPVVSIIVNTAILLVGAEVAFFKPILGAAIVAVGLSTLAVTLVAKRKSITTIERILTLNPRDERDHLKIQWGFALVGKITLVFMTLLGLAALSIFGTSGIRFNECHKYGQASSVCNINEQGFVLAATVALVTLFALTLAVSAIISSLKKD